MLQTNRSSEHPEEASHPNLGLGLAASCARQLVYCVARASTLLIAQFQQVVYQPTI